MNDSRLSIFSNAAKAMIRMEPYPHLIIENALDSDVFAQLQDQYPDPSIVLNGREKKDTWYDYPATLACEATNITPLWKDFLAYHTSKEFYLDVVDLFAEPLKQLYPDLESRLAKPLDQLSTSRRQVGAAKNPFNHQSDVSMECQFYVNYTEKARAVRGPHIDRPTELYAALLYFREEHDDSSGSDLNVCAAKDPSELYPAANKIRVDHLPMEVEDDKISIVETAEYKANTLVFFLNSCQSIHAVSPRTATPIARKHINFTADLFGLHEEGLFEVIHKPGKKLKLWLESKPVIWRLATLINN